MNVGRVGWEPECGGKKTYAPDPKPTKRVKDKGAMRDRHARGCVCELNCGKPGQTHHALSKAQRGDDVDANLVCLCLEHHGLVTDEDAATKLLLGEYLLSQRPDTMAYLNRKLKEGGEEWLQRRNMLPPRS